MRQVSGAPSPWFAKACAVFPIGPSMMREDVALIRLWFGLRFDRRLIDGERGLVHRARDQMPCFLAASIDLQRFAGITRYTRPAPDIPTTSSQAQQRVAFLFAGTDRRAQVQRFAIARLCGDCRGELRLRPRQVVRLQFGARRLEIVRDIRAWFIRRVVGWRGGCAFRFR